MLKFKMTRRDHSWITPTKEELLLSGLPYLWNLRDRRSSRSASTHFDYPSIKAYIVERGTCTIDKDEYYYLNVLYNQTIYRYYFLLSEVKKRYEDTKIQDDR